MNVSGIIFSLSFQKTKEAKIKITPDLRLRSDSFISPKRNLWKKKIRLHSYTYGLLSGFGSGSSGIFEHKNVQTMLFLSVLNFYLNVISGSNSGLVSGLPSASSFAFYLNFFFNNNFLLLTKAKTTKLRWVKG